jgi:hypothetical protein
MIKRADKKGDVEIDELIKWGIAIFVLIIFLLFYFFGMDWGKSAIEFIRNFLRFGR